MAADLTQKPLSATPLCFVDLEMTGLDVAIDRVVEVCIERWVGEECEGRLVSLVNPEGRVGPSAHIHGLAAEELAHAPLFAALADKILELFHGAVPVGHAVAWDLRFLEKELRRLGKRLPEGPFVDTLTLSRRCFATHRHSLDALAETLAIPRGQAHRAASDVLVTRALFARCVALLRPVSLGDLLEVRTGERAARAEIVRACEEACARKAPVRLVYRPARRRAQEIDLVVTEVRSTLDPPQVVGYQLPGRGRRELRTDRILSVEPLSPGDPTPP